MACFPSRPAFHPPSCRTGRGTARRPPLAGRLVHLSDERVECQAAEESPVQSVSMSEGNKGYPHEEGDGFRAAEDCPF